jgi:hypothetical protein
LISDINSNSAEQYNFSSNECYNYCDEKKEKEDEEERNEEEQIMLVVRKEPKPPWKITMFTVVKDENDDT